jgi:hypothetical protein
MSWCSVRAVLQRNADQRTLGLFGGLADRFRHFLGLALAKADTTTLVADNDKCRKAKALAALDGFRHAVDRDQTVGEFRGFFRAVVAAVIATAFPAVVTFCHMAFLHWWRGKAPLCPILVSKGTRIIGAAPAAAL